MRKGMYAVLLAGLALVVTVPLVEADHAEPVATVVLVVQADAVSDADEEQGMTIMPLPVFEPPTQQQAGGQIETWSI